MIPDAYTVRAAEPGDLAGVAACVRADDIATFGEPDDTEDDIRVAWSLPRFTLGTDAWVVVTPDAGVVAYGEVWEKVEGAEAWIHVRVHPDHAGRGLAEHLLDRAEARAAAFSPAITLVNPVPTIRTDAVAILTARGYKPTRHDWRMRIDLPDGYRAGDVPAGVSIVAFEPERDARAMHGVLNESFTEHRHFSPFTFEEWARISLEDPHYTPETCFTARVDGAVVGAVFSLDVGEFGWVRTLGVLAEHRRRGVGRALLEASFASLAARGQTNVMLGVDSGNRTGATRLYEEAGMRVVREFDFYERVLGS